MSSLGHLVQPIFVATLVDKGFELPSLDLEELTGLAELDNFSRVENHNLVGVHLKTLHVSTGNDLSTRFVRTMV